MDNTAEILSFVNQIKSGVIRLTLTDFRNYAHLRINADLAPIVITGDNGVGKTNILEICVKNGCPFPEEYFSPVPPEVSDFYMADPKRVENMIVRPAVVTTVKAKFDQKQLAFA